MISNIAIINMWHFTLDYVIFHSMTPMRTQHLRMIRQWAQGASLLLLLTLQSSALSGCAKGSANGSCASCHRSLELASASHPSCVSCHGGDPLAKTATVAHWGMAGL